MGMEVQISGVNQVKTGMGVAMDQELLSVARLWIRQALTSVLQGDTTCYNQLIQEISNIEPGDPVQEANLVMTLRALSQAVSSINEHHHGSLLSCVLGLSIWNYSLYVADALMEFIINLATSNGGFVDRCLDMLVRNFLPPSCGLPLHMDSLTKKLILGGRGVDQLFLKKEAHLARKNEILDHVHSAIQKIAELVPTAALRLQPIILRRMPHRIIQKDWNALYMENMLRVESSAVGEIIGSRILMAVVDRLIEIDVEIRWEHILNEDSSKVYIFDMEMEDDDENEEDPGKPGSEANVQLTKSSAGKQSLGEVADKMDMLMELTLNHLKLCAEEGRLPQVYDTLMHSFQSTIMNTHKSKFTQFLIFYLCSLAPATCGANFASMLCDIFTNKSRAANTRMTAAAYLASYLARAKYLPLFAVSASLKRLVEWCLQYSPQQNNEKKAINPALHGVFYSACQAVMYVLCFRLKSLMDDPKQKLLIEDLPLKKILEHKLSPLKVCLPSVVEEFLRQVKAVHLFDVSEFTSSNNMLKTEESKAFGGVERLDMFFPFDPYLLRQSDRFVRPYYTFWSMVSIPVDDDEFEDHMLEEEEDPERCTYSEDLMFENTRNHNSRDCYHESSDNEDIEDFECAMNKMSITPKRTTFGMPPKLLSSTGFRPDMPARVTDMPARLYPTAI
uniref:TSA: Wollemia nobilis Ref_Wollemi_Transcript_4138_2773 transcribed RNA sequence n=1 Tax=Wollemia nobilis TaxID=56998 RepID=A0A0C9S8N3_9CONI